jgi:hypothetical protein
MLGTCASFSLILIAAAVVGQGAFGACGRRAWSWLSPAVGLAVITAVAWGTVRLPGNGVFATAVVGLLALASAGYLYGRLTVRREAIVTGLAVAALAAVAASLPFFVEGRFGILGTGLDPDMSQHLFAASRLAHGEGGRLLAQGYPLGPHAVVVATSKATGASLVHCFDGLELAVAVSAAAAPLALLGRLARWRRIAGALLIGLPYLVASFLIQGAFKETMEALFVLAFAIGLHELARGKLTADPDETSPRRSALAAVPLAALAIGSVYVYSFPGLLWLAGAAGLWAIGELVVAFRHDSRAAWALLRRSVPATAVAAAVLAAAAAPEVGRMIDFASFETFNPSGAGLGNLFNPISPLEALGIWPSGDFRLDPGDGAVPAVGYYLGELLGLAALGYGLVWWLRRRELAVPAALAVAAALYAYAHFAGTPYQAAKSIVIASPLAMLIAARALLSAEGALDLGWIRGAIARRRRGPTGVLARNAPLLEGALAVAFLFCAAACSVLALANGPVGPATYSPALTELRPALGADSTLVLAPANLLGDEHGRDYINWELRGGRVCVEVAGPPSGDPPPAGIAHVITQGPAGPPPFANLTRARRSGAYTLWVRHPAPPGHGGCTLISVGARASPASG